MDVQDFQSEQTLLVEKVSRLEAMIDEDSGNSTNIVDVVKDFTDKFLLNLEFPRTCHDYLARGVRQSGYQYIDPDGFDHGDGPFKVLCRFQGTELMTEIEHDSLENFEVTPCEGVGCYHRTVNYTVTQQQMTSLISASQSCEQAIQVSAYP